MKIVAISDTHTMHHHIQDDALEEADVLVHAGDILNRGTLVELDAVADWFESIGHRYDHIVFTPGNHDRCFEQAFDNSKMMLTRGYKNFHVLVDNGVYINGMLFYGSPWQPAFCDWAFNLPRGEALAEKWAKIPSAVDILVTHSPPYQILDRCDGGNVGCEALAERLFDIKPKAHIFGHIHESYGKSGRFYNASICDGYYNPDNKPHIIRV